MHGRIKVRTTEEERERKKKEQALKVKAYKAAMGKIQCKRQHEELDDDMLLLTSQILLRNPDVSTLWNIRRQCVEIKVKTLEEEDKNKVVGIYDAELNFSEQCLMVNPKSYGAWHHRCWSLEHSPQPNWEREVQLCTKYLKMDERNFLTWNYRRYVAAKAKVDKQVELDFCTEKIKVNFSNYSSWHYRSLLLPQLYPYEGEALPKRPMNEAKLKEELEMVLTAAFTDPNDSSAWFYQRWLLGYSQPLAEVCAFRCDGRKAVLALTKAIAGETINAVLSSPSGDVNILLEQWQSPNKTNFDNTWLVLLSNNTQLTLENSVSYQLKVSGKCMEAKEYPLKMSCNSLYYFVPPHRSFAYSAAVVNELQSQLESCNDLLEYEPDSKWTLLTSALLMRAIDCELYHDKSLEYLKKLQKVDSLREGYYRDLASKWIIEKLLTDWANSKNIPEKLVLAEEPQLTSMFYGQYLSIADRLILPKDLTQFSASNLKTFITLELPIV